jgi:ketosteroid isomerase-like protein
MTSDTGRSGILNWMPAYVEAWNSHDPAKVLACMTDDVVFDDKGSANAWRAPTRCAPCSST